MRTTTVEKISSLQENPKNIRNICILAHVDHGKTTLADALVASNGIISSRLAGKLRYMDSREDEQIRGITMKSSAISLHYAIDNEEYLINLIDSPGHVDFSSEVSTAVRLCDGAIVVIDAVEGVSPQTQVVLRQAWLENIHPCLVVNKIDRLITELKFSPVEAHLHLQRILEQVNAITGKLFSSEVMEKSSSKTDNANNKSNDLINDHDTAVSIEHWSSGLDEADDSALYFSPDLGNVVFASAIDGWGFSINDFAAIYAKKLGLNADILSKTLWGDFYLDTKTKRIFKKAQSKGKKPLFVQFILQNIWSVYDAVVIRRDKLKTEQIVKSLNLKISARDSRSTDPRVQLRAILGQWLPLSSVVLNMVVNKLPSPLEMVGERVEKLLCSGLRAFESLPEETKNLKQAFLSCASSEEAPVIVFVSKMFAVDDHSLPKHRKRPLTQEEIAERREQARQKHAQMLQNAPKKETNEVEAVTITTTDLETAEKGTESEESSVPKTHFMAFARVYSGTIKKGQRLYVLGPKHDPRNISDEEKSKYCREKDAEEILTSNSKEGLSVTNSIDLGTNQNITVSTVDDLYLLMGRELESIDCVPAGNVLGIGGLQNHVLKSATLSNTVMCPPFTALHMEARPIVRVAVEPEHYADLPALSRGMRLLNQADPCVEIYVARTGEHVIVAAGEVHLQKCIDDLKERFACVPFHVSSPIIPFRETVVLPPTKDMVNEAIEGDSNAPAFKQQQTDNDGTKTTVNKNKTLVEISTANKQCTIQIRATPLPDQVTRFLESQAKAIKLLISTSCETKQLGSQLSSHTEEDIKVFYSRLKELFGEAGAEWKGAVDKIWAFGPGRVGPNILLNRVPDYNRPSIWLAYNRENKTGDSCYRSYDNSILSGFQLATLAGPLCEEPLMGVCFVVEDIIMEKQEITRNNRLSNTCKTGSTSSFTDGNQPDRTSDSHARNFVSETAEIESGLLQNNMAFKEVSTENQSIESTAISIQVNDEEQASSVDISTGNEKEAKNVSEEKKISALTDTSNSDNENLAENEQCTQEEIVSKGSKFDRHGPFSGQLMSAVKEGCRRAFQLQPTRLMAAMYTCHIQATAEVLGRMYAVIAKREGRVLGEEMMEGSDVFDVEAVLPVAESFGFSEQIRKRTSGLANPQLVFSHWEILDIDPFWVPTTEEEYTHFGVKADSDNQARKYMNTVRRRKGLYVEEKTVEHAEKQRTLKK